MIIVNLAQLLLKNYVKIYILYDLEKNVKIIFTYYLFNCEIKETDFLFFFLFNRTSVLNTVGKYLKYPQFICFTNDDEENDAVKYISPPSRFVLA